MPVISKLADWSIKGKAESSNTLRDLFSSFSSCSTDPTVIHLSSETNSLPTFRYSFYLYNILKELIPFEIQCQIFNDDPKPIPYPSDCSSSIAVDHEQAVRNPNGKKDYTYVLFRSAPVHVTRQLRIEQNQPPSSSEEFCRWKSPLFLAFVLDSLAPQSTVHHIECFFFAFYLFVPWILS